MLVLASASPRRRELLIRLGVAFTVAPADVDETPLAGLPAEAAAQAVALKKATAIAGRETPPILAADTMVVTADGEILGKPADAEDARRMLRKLSGTTHRVVTGVAFIRDRAQPPVIANDTTWVTMRPLSASEIDDYVASGESFDKAGAYAIQETGDRFVTQVRGSWTNVVGLPLELVAPMLRDAGIDVRPWE